MVYNLSLHYTQNVEDAEEITQDVFLQVHSELKSFRAESQLKTWIYRITINKSLDYLRGRKAAKRWSLFSAKSISQNEIKLADSDFNHPGVQLEQKEATETLFAQINQLPENQKTVLILLKIEGLDMKEACEVMNLSYKAVESLMQRAKKNLKEIIIQSKENEK